ncbi:MAG: hypothetical protein JOY61_15570 [Chloroflexi bacterium]|nr:hypothetical protein [Chloroflexota bacterium]
MRTQPASALSAPPSTLAVVLARIDAQRLVGVLAAILLGIAIGHTVQTWLSYDEVWTHPELIGAGAHVWSDPQSEHLGDRLARVAEINDDNRVRPLSKAAEVLDGIARPYVARMLVPHPALTPFTVLALVLPPTLLFLSLRRMGLGLLPSAALLLVFLSCTGFMSTIVAFDRPAKKLTFIFFSLAFYFAVRHERTRGVGSFLACIAALLCGFFSDEEDLVFFVVFGAIFATSLLVRAPNWKRVTFLALPLVFVVVAQWGLSALYRLAGTLPNFDPLGESEKYRLLAAVVRPDFYNLGLHGLAQGMLSTVGVRVHDRFTEVAVLGILFGASAILVYRLWREPGGRATAYRLLSVTLALTAVGLYVTLLDQYPTPGSFGTNGRGYMGEFTYYYHSSMALFVVLWLACAWQALLAIARSARVKHAVVGVGVALCAAVFVANVSLFEDVNRLLQIIHTYPYSSPQMYDVLLAELPTIRNSAPDQPITVNFRSNEQELSQQFDDALTRVFGRDMDTSNNGFYLTMQYFRDHPMMGRENLQFTLHMYFPYNSFRVLMNGA